MKKNDVNVIEEVFDGVYEDSFKQSGLFPWQWESLQVPITPCFGEINAIDLPKMIFLRPASKCWDAPTWAHS